MPAVVAAVVVPLTASADNAHRVVIGVLLDELAELRIAGGSTHDAVVAAAARRAGATLVSLDRRAAATYEQLRVAIDYVG